MNATFGAAHRLARLPRPHPAHRPARRRSRLRQHELRARAPGRRACPIEDDYAALRRELWLRTDEAYKAALELAGAQAGRGRGPGGRRGRGRASATSPRSRPRTSRSVSGRAAEPEALREPARSCPSVWPTSRTLRASRVSAHVRHRAAPHALQRRDVRRRLSAHRADRRRGRDPGARRDEAAQLRPLQRARAPGPAAAAPRWRRRPARWQGARRRCGPRRSPRRARAPCCSRGWRAPAREAAARRSGRGHAAAQDRQAGSDDGNNRARWPPSSGRRSRRPRSRAVDDPAAGPGPGKAPLFGAYKIDDEGVPAQRVSLVEHGVLEVAAHVAHAAQGDRPLQRPRPGAALRRPPRARRHAGGERRAPAAPRGAAARSWARSPRAAASPPTSSACSTMTRCPGARPTTWRRCSRSGWAATGRRRCGRWSSTALDARQGDAGARPLAREPRCPRSLKDITAVGRRRDRLQLPGRGRRILGCADDHHLAAAAASPTSTCGARPDGTASRRSTRRRWPGIEVRYPRCLGSTSRSATSTRSFRRWSGSSSTCSSCGRGCARSRSSSSAANVRMSREEILESDDGSPEVRRAKALFRGYYEALSDELGQVRDLGGEVKDVEIGLVDFPVGAAGRGDPPLLALRREEGRLLASGRRRVRLPAPRRRRRGQRAASRGVSGPVPSQPELRAAVDALLRAAGRDPATDPDLKETGRARRAALAGGVPGRL